MNLLMCDADPAGLTGAGRVCRDSGVPFDETCANRRNHREGLNKIWVSHITNYKTPWNTVFLATLTGGDDGWFEGR